MASRLYKCYGTCGEKYPIEDLEIDGGKKYCAKCLEQKIREKKDRKELYETIQKLFNVSYPTGMMLKQIKEYREQNNYTLKGMTLTLNYCSKLPGINFTPTMGIGIIPHQYERAKLDFLKRRKQEEKCVDIDLSLKPIIIEIPKLKNENTLKKERLISLEDILND